MSFRLQYMTNRSNAGLAFILGAAIGAGIAIAYAHDKGSVSCGNIRRGLAEQTQKFSEVGDALKTKIPTKEQIEDTFDELTENVNEKTHDIIGSLEEKLAKLKAAADAMKK